MSDTHVKIYGREFSNTTDNEYERLDATRKWRSEALKLSKVRHITLVNKTMIGGTEDCLDIVRGEDNALIHCTFIPSVRTKQIATIKGGVKGVTLNDCTFIQTEKPNNIWGADIVLGDWTNYDVVQRPKVRDVVFIAPVIKMSRPLVIAVLHSEKPRFVNTDMSKIKVKVFPRWFVWLRFNVRRLFDKFFVDKSGYKNELILEDWEK